MAQLNRLQTSPNQGLPSFSLFLWEWLVLREPTPSLPILLVSALIFLAFCHLVHSFPPLCQSLNKCLLPGLPQAAGCPWG